MSQEIQSHDYTPKTAQDVSTSANIKIWFYLILLGVSLFLLIWGLVIMYRFWVDDEQQRKIGQVKTRESVEYNYTMKNYADGKEKLFVNKENVSITKAQKEFLEQFRNNS